MMLQSEMSFYGLLFVAGLGAGAVDAVAGGGGLITVPTLLLSGLSPAQALATNKLQSIGGTASAAYSFIQSGLVDLRGLSLLITCTFVGASGGAVAVQFIDPVVLSGLIPWLLGTATVYFILSSRLGDIDTRQRVPVRPFAFVVGGVLGFYDGFFGPGTGAFWVLALAALLGHNLRRATAEAKVLNCASNVASLALFFWGGKIVWTAGVAMGVGQIIGARIGASLVVARGTRLVRPVLITASALVTAKLLAGSELGATIKRALE